ncbi:MAG: hypothetical protein M3235_00025 [Actinomycetota bacterium]|nr:hypothetical protein [Actinomycetota bacterium]
MACSVLAGAGAGPVASAATVPTVNPLDDPNAKRTVVPEGFRRGIADLRNPITYCVADGDGLNCNGSRFRGVTYEVNAQFGVSGDQISGTLGVSRSETVTVQAGCQSDKAKQGFVYVTYPAVTRYFFHVVADNRDPNFVAYGPDGYPAGLDRGSVEQSPQLTTDVPDGGVVCRAERVDQPPWNTLLPPGT